MSPPISGDVQVVQLSQIREEIRTEGDKVLTRAREHCAKNTAQSVTPFQELARELDQQINGKRGDGHSSGIAWRVETLTGKMSMVENAQARHAQEMGKLDDVLEAVDELRNMTWPGRLPRTERVTHPDSEAPGKKPPFIDKDLFKLILLVVATMAGTGGGTAAYQAIIAPDEQAIKVQSDAIADAKVKVETDAERARAELERRERDLARREAWIEKRAASQRGTGGAQP